MAHRTARRAWIAQGGAIRRVADLREAEVVVRDGVPPVALLVAGLDADAEEAALAVLLARLWLIRYGTPEARAQLRAWLRGD